MRAVSLHRDVIVVTSAVLHVNCVIVRGAFGEESGRGAGRGGEDERGAGRGGEDERGGETFVIDSPVLPDELDALPALLEQAQFAFPSGLLATHGDWDHLLGRLAFPDVALGCGESTAERMNASPGAVQRELRAFDEDLLIERSRPLALGSVQALPVPGRCALGENELELHSASGHTADGMIVAIPWARVLAVGDYLSSVELPMLGDGGQPAAYLATLERLRALAALAAYVVPGHGPVLDRERALAVLEEDRAYLLSLREHGRRAELPAGRTSAMSRLIHARNADACAAGRGSAAQE